MDQQAMDAAIMGEATRTLGEPGPAEGEARPESPSGTPPASAAQEEQAEETAPAPEPEKSKYGEFGDDPSKFVESYRHLRSWTTRASMENANLKRQLAATLEAAKAPAAGDPDEEGIDPEARKLLDKYLDKKLAPLAQTVTAMTASARENAVQRHHAEQLASIQQKNPELYADPVVIEAFRNVLQQRPFLMAQPGGIMDAFREARDIVGTGRPPAPASAPPTSPAPPATIAGKGGAPTAPKGPTFDQLVKDAASDGPNSDRWNRVMEYHMRRSGMI